MIGGEKAEASVQYSTRFKERMVRKLTGPGAKSATALSKEIGVCQGTLSRWLREAKLWPMGNEHGKDGGGRASARRRWTPEEKVRLFAASTGLSQDELGAFLRREGLHEAELQRLREEVEQAATEGLRDKRRRKGLSPDQKRVRKLEKELARKEKALAETAALLVLQGKVQAFLSAEEEGDTPDSND